VLQFEWLDHVFSKVVRVFVYVIVLGAATIFILPAQLVPAHSMVRDHFIVFLSFSFLFICLEKLFIRSLIIRLRRRGHNFVPIILFGRGPCAAGVVKKVQSHPEWGLKIIRYVDISTSPAEFEQILKKCYVEEVFFCIPRDISKSGFYIDAYIRVCEEMGRSSRVFQNIVETTRFAQWKYGEFLGYQTIMSYTAELDPDQVVFKRLFDILGAVVGMLIYIGIFPFVACAIKATSKGPVLFRQVRVGKHGKRFILYKFRSMCVDAEEKKKALARKNELKGAIFKIKDDPRVTPVGRFLRKYSIDEIPQFLNVLKGDMALVGTRPPTPDEVDAYESWHFRRISTKPGMTGLWQVSGRSRIENFDDVVNLDLQYIDSWSIWLDMKIIMKTVVVLFHKESAY
jgi:exopolysaccharide biosynthesis polyprenyl glycosylphosphotransferase